ncbi:MAG: sugar phosphate isomerase/epimerase [Candidatus Moranbacteria bacterium]|nr:sugar phosphate isomerase/epimerase [Candidatus Moranbacteria bacterium]
MRFGYMSGWRGDLLSEFAFAKRHFDFTEVTIVPDALAAVERTLPELVAALDGFPTLGHLHWDFVGFDDIERNIRILERLGAGLITMHPFENVGVPENIDIMERVSDCCRGRGIRLMIENVSNEPYATMEGMAPLPSGISNVGLTFDVGHANKIGELGNFLDRFGDRVGHVHLHDNVGKRDHLFFSDRNRLKANLEKLRGIGYDGTVTLETFADMKDGRSVSLGFDEIKSFHPVQVEMLRK